jgi:uncharacterized protein (DUF433 family)
MLASDMSFPRITIRADQMDGAPCIRGLRIPVVTVVRMVRDGMSHEEILALYPYLVREDIDEALRYTKAQAASKRRAHDRAGEIIRRAQQSSGLSDEDAMKLAVAETREVRRQRAKRRA